MLGQVFLRKTGLIVDGKEVVIIAGNVTLSEEESATLQNETQYVISGATLSHPIDRKEEARGMMIDSILRMPIWRV